MCNLLFQNLTFLIGVSIIVNIIFKIGEIVNFHNELIVKLLMSTFNVHL